MKKSLFSIMFLVFAAFFSACVGENEKVSPSSVDAFEALYPKSRVGGWDSEAGYEIVRFKDCEDSDAEAWFDYRGWVMTCVSISFDCLPEEARQRFESRGYLDWEILGVVRLERKGMEVAYVVGVERNKVAYDLYFSESGILVKKADVTNASTDRMRHLPQSMPDAVMRCMDEKYKEADVYSVDLKNDIVEVNFLCGERPEKAIFLSDGTWMMTAEEIEVDSLPVKVADSVADKMPGCEVLDAVLVRTPSLCYYAVDCDNGGITSTVYVNGGDFVDKAR